MTSLTRIEGLFAIPWRATEVDGVADPLPEALAEAMVWRWSGEALRLDGPQGLLSLAQPAPRRRARRTAARLLGSIGTALAEEAPGLVPRAGPEAPEAEPEVDDAPEAHLQLTDGRRLYTAILVPEAGRHGPLLAFLDCLPPPDTDLFPTAVALPARAGGSLSGGVVCFAPGTRIATPQGEVAIDALRPGDMVQTRDDGAQPVEWVGTSQLSAPRLRALPGLRPVRLRGDALGAGRPGGDLLVSPDHRILLAGPIARALFGEPEVLVAARDLVNDGAVHVDHRVREMTYVHLMLPRHAVIEANGLPCESLHPGDMDLDRLDGTTRRDLLRTRPELAGGGRLYGPHARLCLDRAGVALLAHAGGVPG